MTKLLREQKQNQKGTLLVAVGLAAIMAFAAGCGGGGGSSSSTSTTGTPTPTKGTVTGILLEKSTSAPLISYNVKVSGTPLVGATDSTGRFTIQNVVLGTQTLIVADSVGSQVGTLTINVTKANASNDIGTVKLDTSGTPPPPPI